MGDIDPTVNAKLEENVETIIQGYRAAFQFVDGIKNVTAIKFFDKVDDSVVEDFKEINRCIAAQLDVKNNREFRDLRFAQLKDITERLYSAGGPGRELIRNTLIEEESSLVEHLTRTVRKSE